MTISQLDRIKGCFLGVEIGDALGMSVESLSATKIKELVGEVTTYHPPLQKNISDTMKLEPGDTTDDWQLTRKLAESLIDSGGLDITDLALKHVEAFENSITGWGKSTHSGIKQLKTFFDTRGKKGRSPNQSLISNVSKNTGAGNGVAMKIAPYALFRSLICKHEQLESIDFLGVEKDIVNIAGLTHSDPRAASAGLFVCLEIMTSMGIQKTVIEHEMNNIEFSDKLTLALSCKSEDELLEKVGVGCFCLQSVPTAIAMARKYNNDFKTGMIKTIGMGGDADTSAAIFGSIVGSNVGIQGIPKEWMLPKHEETIKLAERFYQVCLDQKPRRMSGGFGRA